MRKLNLFLVFLLSIATITGQQQHTYSSKEHLFNNWIKRSDETAYQWGSDVHRVGALLQTYWYEIRNFNCWQWSYGEIPTEAIVTSVTIKFRARKGDYNDTFKFSLHNIPYALNTQNINFFNESNYYEIYLSDEIVPDANKYIYFNQTFSAQSPVGQGWEIWNAVNNAVQSGNYFLTLGIRERVHLLLPYWVITSYDGLGTVYDPSVDLIINFTTPNNYYSQ